MCLKRKYTTVSTIGFYALCTLLILWFSFHNLTDVLTIWFVIKKIVLKSPIFWISLVLVVLWCLALNTLRSVVRWYKMRILSFWWFVMLIIFSANTYWYVKIGRVSSVCSIFDKYLLTNCRVNKRYSGSKIFYACMCLVMFNSWDPMGCSPPGSSVHGILQARKLE